MAGEKSSTRRRALLSGVCAALCGGVAGCSTALRQRSGTVSMLAAGSLNNALENGLRPSADAAVAVEARGSAEVARLVAAGQKDPEIVSVADVALFDAPLRPAWFAEFATNSLVVAYNPETEAGRRLAAAGSERWYRPILEGDVAIGRTDPDLDPLGYRTLIMLELATSHYNTDTDLRAALPCREQVYPETQLVSQFETGAIDAAFAYRNMAAERGYEYIDLPPAIDLSDPSRAETYATATYELPTGKIVRGGPISYGSTIRDRSQAVVDVFDEHITGQYLSEFGFVVPDDYPRFTGSVPNEITN